MEENIYQSMSDGEVSSEFKLIARTLCLRDWHYHSDQPYIPTLADLEYLVDYVNKRHGDYFLRLTNIILTAKTGSYLGYLLNRSKIREIHMGNIDGGELALIREVILCMKYKFSNSRIRFDRIESLANALNISFISLDFNDGDITEDGLRIILRVVKENLKKSKRFTYDLKWNQLFDINRLGLDELLDCVESHELTVHNDAASEGSQIKINHTSEINSILKIHVDYNKIKIDHLKQFLNQYKSKNGIVKVNEHKTECILSMLIIHLIKDFPMTFEINCSTQEFIGQEKLNEIMESLIKTHLTDLKIRISQLTSDGFETIIDKIKNMKLQRLSFHGMEMHSFNPQTVVEPFRFSGLQFLSIDDCKLNYELTKNLFWQLKHIGLEQFSISGTDLSHEGAHLLSKSLIMSNLTNVVLSTCGIHCHQAKIIAESLKNTKITSINLANNFIKNDGVKAIANIVGQTKLNTLILNWNAFDVRCAVELLKSVQKTKITICCIDNTYWHDRMYEAIANVLKANKILLKCIEKGINKKVDEYLERNNNVLEKAKLIIDKYQKGTILYDYKYKNYFEAYESFIDTDILWNNINNKKTIELKLKNEIKDNYMKICGIVNEKLEVNENAEKHANVSILSLEILNRICSSLSLSDVIS